MKKATKTFTRLRVIWSRVPAQKQLLYMGLACIAALVTFTAWVWVTRAQASINESVKLFGQGLAEALARGGAEALSNSGDLESLRYYILTQRGKLKTIAYIVFEDNAGNILLDPTSKKDLKEIFPVYKQYKENPENFTVPGIYPSPPGYRSVTNIVVRMHKNGQDLGLCWVGLYNDLFTILGTQQETTNFLITIFCLVGVLGALGVWANYTLINAPLRTLSQGASQIATGHFGHQIKVQRAGKEIDQLVNAFNYMSSRLQLYDKHNVDNLMAERNKFISERNKLELVLMSIADGVVVCDRDNRVQIVNRAATQIFDKEAKDLLGKPLVVCTEGPDQPQICHIVQQFTDSNVNITPGAIEPIVQQLQLGELTVRLHTAPIFLNKEFLGSVMIMQDITKQAELEKMKNEFMANVSHELRTPITSIKSYVDTLCNHGEKLDPDIHREFLQIIDNEADRLMHLVNDVLELSKIEEADREFEMLPMDIHRACEAAIRSLNLMARDRGIELAFEQTENLPLASINQESIERVIINLLNNGIKYTPEGGKITVKVEKHQEGEVEEVAVHVKDTGIGIPDDALEHIFDRFYRVEKKVHTIKGTGLGLTIVKKIIEKHGGRITVASALGEGSTFSFYLPALSPEAVARLTQWEEEPDLV
ncbi:MAG: cell wall metabolism sensor histidine kinase WalK [Candidatus Melainabacteria bacterium]|uniref:histidine kinase n=1 Tax=Candidatus Obscuribacter phosphatis TaxID=1906157 RepID=A0A8J7TLW6_9BACT|nr:HAMP domain-containing protein [Candidatus Obscuribacter phosphatis]MCA0315760.1 cell wall metabolism sensor histidine kinase WalK [Candidatus Melainabacteria bacterium]